MTIGGEGARKIDEDIKNQIINRLKEYPYPVRIAEEFGYSTQTIKILAKNNNILVKNYGALNLSKKKTVYQISKNNEIINSFDSTMDAARWCIENNCTVGNSVRGIATNINRVILNKRKYAYGYI